MFPFLLVSDFPIASRSNFPRISRMALAQKTSKRSTQMRMRPFVRILHLSRPKRRRTGRPKARNIQQLASLLNNVKPKSRQRSRPLKTIKVMPRKRTRKRMKSNWHFSSASLSHAFSYRAHFRLRCVFMCDYPDP